MRVQLLRGRNHLQEGLTVQNRLRGDDIRYEADLSRMSYGLTDIIRSRFNLLLFCLFREVKKDEGCS
jgi:hypothetical protein